MSRETIVPKLIDRLTGHVEERSVSSLDDYLSLFDPFVTYSFAGQQYTLPVQTTYGSLPAEGVGPEFGSVVANAYLRNGVVFACVLARSLVFSEARFQFRQIRNGRPGDLFGTTDLEILESPWPNGTTGELLTRMEQDVSLAGNFYCVREPAMVRNEDRLTRLQPDLVKIMLSGPEYDAQILGYAVYAKAGDPHPEEVFDVKEVCHWSPVPDPMAFYRGQSWVMAVARYVEAHNAATRHKSKFFSQGATPNMVVTLPKEIGRDEFDFFRERFSDLNEGLRNAYKTMFLGGGADVNVVGSSFEQMSFKATQGADETLIAAAARVPATLLGISEGLAGSTLNAGNYAQARRQFADGWARPSWRSAAAALSTVVKVPSDAQLWYDDRDIAFLREDAKDDAEIRKTDAGSIRQLIDAGYSPDAVVDAVLSGDYSRLKGNHTDLFSVQLQPPGTVSKNDAPQPDEEKSRVPLRVVRDDEGRIERVVPDVG